MITRFRNIKRYSVPCLIISVNIVIFQYQSDFEKERKKKEYYFLMQGNWLHYDQRCKRTIEIYVKK